MKKTSEKINSFKREVILKRTALCVIGTIFIGLGVTIFLKSQLGSDPTSIFVDGLHAFLRISYGNASLVSNIITLAIALIVARKYIYVGTVIGALLTGPVMNFFETYIDMVFSTDPSFAIRLIMIALGHIIVCYGIAFNLAAKFGFSPPDCIITAICDKTGWQYRYFKIAFDATFTIIGVVLGGIIGIGTVLSVLTGGPVISEIKKLLDKHLLTRMGLTDDSSEMAKVSG